VEWIWKVSTGLESFPGEFEPVAQKFGMRWRLEYSAPARVAILVSQYTHCWRSAAFVADASWGARFAGDQQPRHGRKLTEFYGIPSTRSQWSRSEAQAERSNWNYWRCTA